MHQLGAAAGCAFAKIAALEQERVISARSRIDRHTHACCAASYDDDVPFSGVRMESIEHFRPRHCIFLSAFVLLYIPQTKEPKSLPAQAEVLLSVACVRSFVTLFFVRGLADSQPSPEGRGIEIRIQPSPRAEGARRRRVGEGFFSTRSIFDGTLCRSPEGLISILKRRRFSLGIERAAPQGRVL